MSDMIEVPRSERTVLGYVFVNNNGLFARYHPYELEPETSIQRASVFAHIGSALGAFWNSAQRNGEGRVSKDEAERHKAAQGAGVGLNMTLKRVVVKTVVELEDL